MSDYTASLAADEMDALSARLKEIGQELKSVPFPATPSQTQLGFPVVTEAAGSFFSCAKERAEEVGQWVETSADAVTNTRQEFEETDIAFKDEFRKVADEIFFSADRED